MNKIYVIIMKFFALFKNKNKVIKQPEIKEVKKLKCNIQMDDCSCQPDVAPRCMTCGGWRSEPCGEIQEP